MNTPYPLLTLEEFTAEMERLGFPVVQHVIDGQLVDCFEGVRLKTQEERDHDAA